MKRTVLLVCGLAALVPGVALAAGPEVLNLRDGVPRELLGKMLGLAWGFFGVSLALGLIVEAFRDAPSQQKNYAGVAWRALLVMALLGSYPKVFGTVISTAETIANRVAPAEIWEAFNKHTMETLDALSKKSAATAGDSTPVGFLDGLKPSAEYVTAFVGGTLFDTFVTAFVSIAQAFQWAFFQFSRILLALLYVIGPLALVFHIPGPSETAGRWFRAFVTISAWPIFSAMLLSLATALMYRTNDSAMAGAYATAFGALASSLLFVVLNLAVPLLASALIGGGIRNVVAPSLGAAAFGAVKMAGLLAPAAQGLTGALQQATQVGQSAAGGLRSALSPAPLPPLNLSSAEASSSAAPMQVAPAGPNQVLNWDAPGPAAGAASRPPGDLTVAARGQGLKPAIPGNLPRPPGLSTKDLTMPGAPQVGPPVQAIEPADGLIVSEQPLALDSPYARPPPPPADATKS